MARTPPPERRKKMDERNYITFPIAKKLSEAGIRMESECGWISDRTSTGIVNTLLPMKDIHGAYYPAYTFTELLDVLPVRIEDSNNDYSTFCLRYEKGNNEAWVGYQNYIKDELCAATNPNPADAAALLLIWLKGGKGE